MRKIVVLLLLIIYNNQIKAQDMDSLQQGLKNKLYVSDSITNTLYSFYKNNPFYLNKIPVNFNSINTGLAFDKGKFIPSQGSSKTQNYFFNTEGKTKLEKVDLYGSFTFHKVFEDSTRWAHQTRLKTNVPLYFGSIKYNHYERSVYTFKVMAERNIVSNNLPLNFNVDYRIGNHFSNNDPRGDLRDFQLNTNTTLSYTFNVLKTGLSFRYGYGREGVSIGYKNENVKPLELTNWRNVGYGTSEEFLSSMGYTTLEYRKGLDLNFDYTLANQQNLMLKLSYLKETDNYVILPVGSSSTLEPKRLMDYNTETIESIIFYKFNISSKRFLLKIGYKDESGKDLYYPKGHRSTQNPDEVIYKYNNYLYNLQTIDFKLIAAQNNLQNHSTLSTFIATSFNKEGRQDGSSGNNVIYERLNISGGLNLNKKTLNNKTYGIGLSGAYSFSPSNTFIVPQINEKVFYKYVIYHDYLYNTSKYAILGLDGEYSLPAYKFLQASIKFHINYTKRLGEFQPLDRALLSIPGKDMFSSNLSLNLYF